MDVAALHNKLREIRDGLEKNHAVRLHRAVSWLECAEIYSEDDEDIAFIALWIAFNACYAIDDRVAEHDARQDFRLFTGHLCILDTEQRIHSLLWLKYSQFVRLLINNQYVYPPFWKSVREGNEDWKVSFEQSKNLSFHALASNDTPLLLSIILDRLYVLRNQLLHGAATYRSSVNRSQVRDGKNLLMEFMPLCVGIMLEGKDWGDIYYPVIES